MNVKTAFLEGMLKKDIYIVQPRNFEAQGESYNVYKLKRSIYGFKQALRSQNLCFDSVVKQFGFIKNENESCIYKKVCGSVIAFLALQVDGILLTLNDVEMLTSIKSQLFGTFSMKDVGELTYILGIHVYRERERARNCQVSLNPYTQTKF